MVCSQAAPRSKWGYMCTACPAYFCSAPCRRRGFEAHVCSDDLHATAVRLVSEVSSRFLGRESGVMKF